MQADLPFSQACENNKGYILEILRRHLGSTNITDVVEIGSGTGQHAECFATSLPNIRWQSTDLAENLNGLMRRIECVGLDNLPAAIELDVTWSDWPCETISNVFSANSLHIMSAAAVEHFFEGIARHLDAGGLLFVYGPFKYQGEFTTPSNEAFDGWLKNRDPRSGIRDFEFVNDLAQRAGLELLEDNAMPANNQLLVWRRTTSLDR